VNSDSIKQETWNKILGNSKDIRERVFVQNAHKVIERL